VRLFLALDIAPHLKDAIGRLKDRLARFQHVVRWVGREQTHMTLKFIGESAADALGDIRSACSNVAAQSSPFEWSLERVGCFPPNGKVRVLWAGASQTPPELLAMAERCDTVMQTVGIARESRPFAAHVTFGRVRNDDSGGKLRAAVDKLDVKTKKQRIVAMTLFESTLKPEGPQYGVIATFPFGGIH